MTARLIAAATLAAGAALLSGCEQEVSGKEMETYVDEKARTDSTAQISKEDAELKSQLSKLQAQDPTVKDAYYGVDENGNKQLHVITQQPGEEKSESSVWPLVAGMAGGYLLGSIMSSGGVQQYAQTRPPVSHSYYSREDERKKRNTYSSAYMGAVVANNRSAIYKSTPPNSPALKQAVLNTRSQGIFAGGGSGNTGGGAKGVGGAVGKGGGGGGHGGGG